MSQSPLQPVAGTEGRVEIITTVAGTPTSTLVNLYRNRVQEQVDDIPATNYESALVAGAAGAATIMAKEGLTGAGDVDIDLEGLWDAGANQFANPPNLIPGIAKSSDGTLTQLNVYLRKTGSRRWNFSAFRVLQSSTEGNAQQGGVVFRLRAKSQGTWTRPA